MFLSHVNANDEIVATTLTDAEGRSLFSGTYAAGVYRIFEFQPDGLLDGKETAGS